MKGKFSEWFIGVTFALVEKYNNISNIYCSR
ncbi:unknown [Clostridium sp. CAG:356]|nr:unknown [Clostridium sp. CAG:356]